MHVFSGSASLISAALYVWEAYSNNRDRKQSMLETNVLLEKIYQASIAHWAPDGMASINQRDALPEEKQERIAASNTERRWHMARSILTFFALLTTTVLAACDL